MPEGPGREVEEGRPATFSRRKFLQAAALAGATTAVSGAFSSTATRATAAVDAHPFHGAHPVGVVEDPSPAVCAAAFDVVLERRSELVDLMRSLTDIGRFLTMGGVAENLGPASPPDDNGILGPRVPAHQLVMTVGFGASLFDDRFGLGEAKPRFLREMTPFPNDNLHPAQSQGDLSIQLQASEMDTLVHGLRYLMKYTDGAIQPRWRIQGVHAPPRPSGTPRNYQGFKDGIAHPDVGDPAVADELLWVQRGGGEPNWAAGGAYQVIRIIRMLSEFWDRVSLQEQETMIGRRKDSGAPLDGNTESDIPDYAADPQGKIIPLTAHIRIANPRTKSTAKNQILRRGWNYDQGLDVDGNLDQGLIFTCYQRDLDQGFVAVQTRLIGEPLVDYISPIGGGYFFLPPGVVDSRDYYGSGLFAAV